MENFALIMRKQIQTNKVLYIHVLPKQLIEFPEFAWKWELGEEEERGRRRGEEGG